MTNEEQPEFILDPADEPAPIPLPRPAEISGKAKRHLRGLAHSLKPLVHVGKNGIEPALCKQVAQTLHDHELIKVRFLDAAPTKAKDGGAELATQTGSHVVSTVGKLATLYRQRKNKPEIKLPR